MAFCMAKLQIETAQFSALKNWSMDFEVPQHLWKKTLQRMELWKGETSSSVYKLKISDWVVKPVNPSAWPKRS